MASLSISVPSVLPTASITAPTSESLSLVHSLDIKQRIGLAAKASLKGDEKPMEKLLKEVVLEADVLDYQGVVWLMLKELAPLPESSITDTDIDADPSEDEVLSLRSAAAGPAAPVVSATIPSFGRKKTYKKYEVHTKKERKDASLLPLSKLCRPICESLGILEQVESPFVHYVLFKIYNGSRNSNHLEDPILAHKHLDRALELYGERVSLEHLVEASESYYAEKEFYRRKREIIKEQEYAKRFKQVAAKGLALSSKDSSVIDDKLLRLWTEAIVEDL